MPSADLEPGVKLRHKSGFVCTLDRRKKPEDDHRGLPYHPGWWLVEGGGLADMAVDKYPDNWEVI